MDVWKKAGTKHPVFLAELLPLAIAAETWAHKIAGRKVIVFLDNDAARLAMIKGYSPLLAAAAIIGGAWAKLAAVRAYVWFARVASEANPADAPSRLQGYQGGRRVTPKLSAKFGPIDEWLVM